MLLTRSSYRRVPVARRSAQVRQTCPFSVRTIRLQSFSGETFGSQEIITLYPSTANLEEGGPVEAHADVDIFAVHGLGSNSEYAWTHPISSKNWLKDFLPSSVSRARILAFNHDSKWRTNASFQSLTDYGESLLLAMRLVRKTEEERNRPLVFVGHSFGGTIIKKALNIASARLRDQDSYYYTIASAVRGIVFLGTPHGGSSYVNAGRMSAMLTTLLGSRTELLEFIDPQSRELSELNDTFLRSYSKCDLFCFFEARPPKNSLGIPQPLVVDKSSAIIPGRPHAVLNLDHMELNKFSSENDQNYQKVCEVLQRMVDQRTYNLPFDTDTNVGGIFGQQHRIMSNAHERKQQQSIFEQSWSLNSIGSMQASFESSEAATQAKQQLEQIKKEDEFLEMMRSDNVYFDEDEIPPRHKGTCEWITHNNQYQEWNDSNSTNCKFLMIVAGPGWGKSVLAKHLLHLQMEDKPPSDDHVVLGFFCKNTVGQNTASAILKSFLYRLLSLRRDLFRHVLPHFTKRRIADNTISFKSLWTMFLAILKSPEMTEIRCLIDGLDELEPESQRELLKALESSLTEDSSASLRGKILITSRPTPVAVEIGTRLGILHLRLEDVAHDISSVINTEVDKLAEGRGYPEDIATSIKSKLETDADGMFLWVRLVLEELNRDDYPDTKNAIYKILDGMPRTLEDFYTRNLESIPQTSREDARHIFQTLLAAPAPPTAEELTVLFAKWPESCSTLADLKPNLPLNIGRYAKAACGPLIRVTDNSITFTHQSARDYFMLQTTDRPAASNLRFDFTESNSSMLKACLRYLLLDDIRAKFARKDELSVVDGFLEEFPFADYGIRWWDQHARQLEKFDEECERLLNKWLSEHNPLRDDWVDQIYRAVYDGSIIDSGQAKSHQSLISALIIQDLPAVVRQFVRQYGLDGEPTLQDPLSTALNIKHVDLNSLDCVGVAPLTMAAAFGRIDTVRFLLEKGAKTSVECRTGTQPLHAAATEEIAILLIQAGAEIDEKTKDGSTPLASAASDSRTEIVKCLLERGAKPDEPNNEGYTPLYGAISNGDIAIARKLLKAGANMLACSNFDETMMFAAASSGKEEVLKFVSEFGLAYECETNAGVTPLFYTTTNESLEYLLRLGANLEHRDKEGQTALLCHISISNEDGVRRLLDHGADMHCVNNNGRSALHYACRQHNESIARLILEKDPDIHLEANNRTTALFSAAYRGFKTTAELLIERGSAVQHKDEFGFAPLHVAAATGQNEIVELLASKGADINAKDNSDETALMFALNGKHYETVKMLLELGADPNHANANGSTLLHIAIKDSIHVAINDTVKEIINILLEKGAEVDARLSSGATCLHQAALTGSADLVGDLLRRGADPEITDNLGHTALHYAALHGGSVVQILIDAGPNIDALSTSKNTPLHFAAMIGNLFATRALLEAGCKRDIRNNAGETAFAIAWTEQHIDVAPELIAKDNQPEDFEATSTQISLFPLYSEESHKQPAETNRREDLRKIMVAVQNTVKAHAHKDFQAEERIQFFSDEIHKTGVSMSHVEAKHLYESIANFYQAMNLKREGNQNKEKLKAKVVEVQKIIEESVPKLLQEKEPFFKEEIAKAETLMLNNDEEGNFEAAVGFYKAFKVYPDPLPLVRIYEKNIPQACLDIFFDLLSFDDDVSQRMRSPVEVPAVRLRQDEIISDGY